MNLYRQVAPNLYRQVALNLHRQVALSLYRQDTPNLYRQDAPFSRQNVIQLLRNQLQHYNIAMPERYKGYSFRQGAA